MSTESSETLSGTATGQGQDPLLGIALSGGGVRASLFALGALTYLVDSGKHKQVTEITSVSGGSITNGFIAQRCDFQNVEASKFDDYAKQLATAITSGLVSKRFVITTYGLILAAVVVVTFFSWPVRLPIWLDVMLWAVVGTLLLLRGVLLARMFQQELFGSSDLPASLGSIESTVAHIFCATDLNASMPVYLTTAGMHFYSPAWGPAAPDKTADIRVTDAVRASAAFPLGIPPKRLDVHGFGVTRTPLQKLKQWQQLVFRHVRQQPCVLYLADGGVWNNLGTDWFDRSTRQLVASGDDWHPRAEQCIIVDAGAPTPAKLRLRWFWVPYVAEILALFRVWLVSYTSTVNARIERLTERAESDASSTCEKYRPLVVRMIDPVPDGVALGRLVWIGDQDHWSGRWSLWLTLNRLVRGQVPAKRLVVRDFNYLNKWTSWVPTTLFSIPPEVALQLLIHGYISTAQALTESPQEALTKFPGIERFANWLGLEAHRVPYVDATFLGPISVLIKRYPEIIERCIDDRTTFISEENKGLAERSRDIDTLVEQGRRSLERVQDEEMDLDGKLGLRPHGLSTANLDAVSGRHEHAVERYQQVFSKVNMEAESITAFDLAHYAVALAHTADAQARDVASIAEKKLKTVASIPVNGKAAALDWSVIAEVYALLDDSKSAVRCLRESLAQDPDRVKRWLVPGKFNKQDHFARVRNSPDFKALENEVLAIPLEKRAAAS